MRPEIDQMLLEFLDEPTQPRLEIARVLSEEMTKDDLHDAHRIATIVNKRRRSGVVDVTRTGRSTYLQIRRTGER